MSETKKRCPDIVSFAALGAMRAGEQHAAADMRKIGSPFLGAMPAADALGLTAEREESDDDYRLLRSLFIHGYVCYLNRGTVLVDTEGRLVSFTLEPSKKES